MLKLFYSLPACRVQVSSEGRITISLLKIAITDVSSAVVYEAAGPEGAAGRVPPPPVAAQEMSARGRQTLGQQRQQQKQQQQRPPPLLRHHF